MTLPPSTLTPRRQCCLLWLVVLSLSSILCSASDVQTFKDVSDFRSQVLESDSVWMVQFYEDRKDVTKVYKETAEVLKGIVKLAAVDVSTEPQKAIAGMLGIRGFPAIQIFGADKKNPTTHDGGGSDPQSLLQSAVSAVGKTVEKRAQEKWMPQGGQGQQSSSSSSGSTNSKVVNLNSANFQEKVLDNPEVGMVAFIAPWCGHCKQLLPEWGQASVLLEDEAYLGVVDATVETSLAAEYGVEGYPTIKIFRGGKNKRASDAIDYMGGRTKEDIVRAALEEIDRSGIPKEIPELIGPEVLKENCEGTNRLCLLVALPHILDSTAAGRNKYKETLDALSRKFRGAVKIVWFEGGAQLDLEQTLELTFGFPAVSALSLDKQVYTTMKGSFSEKSISLFLTGITTGRQSTVPLRKIPDIATVEPWDGLDGVPIEEEPLEDIMGWDEEDDKGGEL